MKSKVIIQILVFIVITMVMTTKKNNLKITVIMIRKANTSNMIIDLSQNLVFLFHSANNIFLTFHSEDRNFKLN